MTTIDGQLWQRCVECETLVPAPTRNYSGVCLTCAPPAAEPPIDELVETVEITADDVGELDPDRVPPDEFFRIGDLEAKLAGNVITPEEEIELERLIATRLDA